MAERTENPIEAIRREVRVPIAAMGAFSFVINILMLAGPLFMLQVYDRVLPSGNVPTLFALVIIVCALYVFLAALDLVRGRVLVRVGRHIDECLQDGLFDAVQFRARQMDSKDGSRPLDDLDNVRNYVSGPGPGAFFDIPWVPVYIGFIFLLHPMLGLFASVAAIALAALAVWNRSMTRGVQAQAHRSMHRAHRFAEETRRQAGTLAAMGMQGTVRRLWAARKTEALEASALAGDRAGLVSSVSRSSRLLFQSGILAVGAWLAIHQATSPGAMIAAAIIMSRALAPLEQLIVHWRNFLAAAAAWKRIAGLIGQTTQPASGRTGLPAPSGAICIRDLVALPPEKGRPILSQVNFQLVPGEGLGIIGPSGAGKSTLARAILGIWPNVLGDIRFDNASIDQWERDSVGRFFGYLPQGSAPAPGKRRPEHSAL